MSVINELRLKRQLCDGLIRVNNVEFPVHKIVLCNCSSFFRHLFTEWSTPDDPDFEIPMVSAEMMKVFIDFAYTDSVTVTEDNVQELFIAADKFGIMGIVEVCCSFMEEHLTPHNCISIWRLTDVYYTAEIKNKAFSFIMTHFEEVASTSEEFLLLCVGDLVKIIEKDQLHVQQEKTVFEAVLRWIIHAAEERVDHVHLLLSNVRIALMSPEYLKNILENTELVRASKGFQQIISVTLEAIESQRVPGLFRPRLPPAILFAVGGWGANGASDRMDTYDFHADCWVNIRNDDSPRAYCGLVFLDGSLYRVGGLNGVHRLRCLERFDLSTNTWHELSHMHSVRSYVSATLLDGYIYVMGGYAAERLRTAERYDPSTNQWTFIAPMNEKRSDAGCATLNGKVYICGGFTGTDIHSSAECYDPATDVWTPIADMGSRRTGVGVVAYAGRVFAVGGFDGTIRLNTVQAYDPHTDTWTDVSSMPLSRSNFGIEVINDRIFVVGGYDGSEIISDVHCFDANTNVWSTFCNIPIPRSALSCCMVYGLPNLDEYAAPCCSLQVSEDEVD